MLKMGHFTKLRLGNVLFIFGVNSGILWKFYGHNVGKDRIALNDKHEPK
jgi:hypothetical protein